MNNQYYGNPYQPMGTRNSIIWVQGVEGAKAYQMVPNSNVLLLDSENDGIFYIKTTDNVGMCSMRTFKYEETTMQVGKPAVDLTEYVRKDELQTILRKMFNPEVTNEQTVSTNANAKPIIQL